MKLSVLAISYNHEKYISQAIESILAQQTNFDFEIIVGDDCSTDKTAEILLRYQRQFPHHFSVIVNEKNLGPHRNFERVYNAARGEYIALLETDDFWCDPLKLQKQVEMLDADRSVSLCFSNSFIIDDNDNVIEEDRVPPECRRRLTQRDIISGYCPPTNTVVFRHSAMPSLPSEYFKCLNGDFIIFIHITNFGDASYLDRKTAFYRKHEKGIWSNKSYTYKTVNFAKTCQTLLTVYRDKYEDILLNHINGCYSQLLAMESDQSDKENEAQTPIYPIRVKQQQSDVFLSLKSIMSLSRIKLYAGDVPAQPVYAGWIGLSLTQHDDRHIIHDITNPLPFQNDSIDAFQAEDVLEHIPYSRLVPVINEIFRVLKTGALFRLSVPDYGCDVLRERSVKDAHGNIVFDPGGGGTPEDPGHVWFPRIENVYRLLEKTRFCSEGTMSFLHYWDMNRPTFVAKPIDYSKGIVRRTPDFDERVKNPYRPMSLVVDLYKGPK